MTTAQRARLVVALGTLNLCLAAAALAVGAFGLPVTVPAAPAGSDQVAGAPSATTIEPAESGLLEPTASATAPTASAPGASPTGSPTGSPTVSGVPVTPTESAPAISPPTPDASPSGTPIIVAGQPSARPAPVATATPRPEPEATRSPSPSPVPSSAPSASPSPAPTPAPSFDPVDDDTRPLPPCPDEVDGPPGHHKVLSPPDRPCADAAGAAASPATDRSHHATGAGRPATGTVASTGTTTSAARTVAVPTARPAASTPPHPGLRSGPRDSDTKGIDGGIVVVLPVLGSVVGGIGAVGGRARRRLTRRQPRRRS